MKNMRERVWVDPFQTRLFYRVGIYWVFYTATLFNLLFAWRLLKEGPGDLWHQFVATGVDSVPLFLCLVFVTPWIGLDAVRFVNRVVGPLSRFRESMQGLAADKPVHPIRLRKGDFLMEMQDDFNGMLAALQERGAIRSEAADEAVHVTGR